MSNFSHKLSVPIDDQARSAQLEKAAANQGMKLATYVRKLIYDVLDGKLVHIDQGTSRARKPQRRAA